MFEKFEEKPMQQVNLMPKKFEAKSNAETLNHCCAVLRFCQ
jgi:hypothetical protein